MIETRLYLPVTMTHRMLAERSWRMTGVVSGLIVLCMTRRPRNWRWHSIWSLFIRCIWCQVSRRSKTRCAKARTRKPRIVKDRKTLAKSAGMDDSTQRVRIVSGEPLTSSSMCGLPKVRTTTDIRCRLELKGNCRTIPTAYGTWFFKNYGKRQIRNYIWYKPQSLFQQSRFHEHRGKCHEWLVWLR